MTITNTMKIRQNVLEANMTNAKTYGQEKYCAHCWACVYGEECLATVNNREAQCLCVKAEKRLQEYGERPLPRKRVKPKIEVPFPEVEKRG